MDSATLRKVFQGLGEGFWSSKTAPGHISGPVTQEKSPLHCSDSNQTCGLLCPSWIMEISGETGCEPALRDADLNVLLQLGPPGLVSTPQSHTE